MIANSEADDIPDAVNRIMRIGLQTKDMFDDGYTEVIFQNPDKRRAVEIDLYRNLR